MSAIFGIVRRDGAPVTIETVDRLRRGTAEWGRDGGGVLCRGAAGLGLALSFNTPEDRFDLLPSEDAKGGMFTAAARVNNRAELASELGLGARASQLSNAGILREAWLRWGERSPRHIFGDWAFAAWNPEAHTLFLARDHSGNTVVYYHENSRFFAFSSSRRALMQLDLPAIEMDELVLARGLVSWRGWEEWRTIHKGIRTLPPAHTLTMTRERLDIDRYWRPEDTRELTLKQRNDYVPAFLDVFDRAVKDSLRADSPVATMLSGGLDSSSVAVTAARHLRETGRRLPAFTSVPQFETSAYTGRFFGDELPFARATAAAAGNIDQIRVEAADLSPIAAIRRGLEISREPKHGACNMYWLLESYRLAAESGHRTLLVGNMGNGSISWSGDIFSQPLSTQVRALGKYRWLRAYARRTTPSAVLSVVQRYRKAAEWKHESAINPEFARRLHLMERYLDDPREVSTQSARVRRWTLVNATTSFVGSTEAEMAAAAGIETLDPTADIRVLMFCLSVPDAVFIDPRTGIDRWLIREAMMGRLPENVRLNRGRGRQAADLVPRLRRSAADVESALTEIENGPGAEYVSVPVMRAVWRRICAEDSPQALKDAVTVLTRGIMAGLFVNGFLEKW